ncbi:MAG: transposase [Candidatus Omnitrophica bacterium]|nr:transposase [Candidatus Omnitrophota bacterium]
MSRPYRLQGKNFFYHITSRGDDRKKIYVSDHDYKKFLEYLQKAKEKYKFHLFAYVLMPNHYHLFIKTTQPNLSKAIHYIKTSYTTYYNIKRRRCGHLFQGRFKSTLVDNDCYFMELTRYIHLNPVRAKMTNDPENYKWSSYKGYLDKEGDRFIDICQIKKYLDMPLEQYREFVLEGIKEPEDLTKKIYAGFLLGSANFIEDRLKDLKEHIENKDVSYKKRLTTHIKADEIIKVVAGRYGKNKEQLINMRSKPMKGKKISIYLIKRLTGLTNREIGRLFNMQFSAVSKAASSIEGLLREDRLLRREIEEITSNFEG